MKLKLYTLSNLQLRNVEIEPVYEGQTLRSIILRADGEELFIKAADYGSQLQVLTQDYNAPQSIQRSLRQIELKPTDTQPPETFDEGIPF